MSWNGGKEKERRERDEQESTKVLLLSAALTSGNFCSFPRTHCVLPAASACATEGRKEAVVSLIVISPLQPRLVSQTRAGTHHGTVQTVPGTPTPLRPHADRERNVGSPGAPRLTEKGSRWQAAEYCDAPRFPLRSGSDDVSTARCVASRRTGDALMQDKDSSRVLGGSGRTEVARPQAMMTGTGAALAESGVRVSCLPLPTSHLPRSRLA